MKKMLCVQILVNAGRSFFADKQQAQAHAAKLFGKLIDEAPEFYDVQELAQYTHLSCWCALDAPCHVDAIIKMMKK